MKVVFWMLGLWAWCSVYREFKANPGFRRFLYWFSAILAPMSAYAVLVIWAETWR